MDIYDEAKALLQSRKQAYETVFHEGVDARIVLQDLAEFCRAHKSAFNADSRVHAMLEGRREVWLRIEKYVKLSPDELWEITRKD